MFLICVVYTFISVVIYTHINIIIKTFNKVSIHSFHSFVIIYWSFETTLSRTIIKVRPTCKNGQFRRLGTYNNFASPQCGASLVLLDDYQGSSAPGKPHRFSASTDSSPPLAGYPDVQRYNFPRTLNARGALRPQALPPESMGE